MQEMHGPVQGHVAAIAGGHLLDWRGAHAGAEPTARTLRCRHCLLRDSTAIWVPNDFPFLGKKQNNNILKGRKKMNGIQWKTCFTFQQIYCNDFIYMSVCIYIFTHIYM